MCRTGRERSGWLGSRETEPGAGNLSPVGRIRLGWTGRRGRHSRQMYRSETQQVMGEGQ